MYSSKNQFDRSKICSAEHDHNHNHNQNINFSRYCPKCNIFIYKFHGSSMRGIFIFNFASSELLIVLSNPNKAKTRNRQSQARYIHTTHLGGLKTMVSKSKKLTYWAFAHSVNITKGINVIDSLSRGFRLHMEGKLESDFFLYT